MAELTVANYLAALQDDPWARDAFEGLALALASKDGARTGDDPVRLLEFARRNHEVRGESFAAAKLIECELALSDSDPDFAVVLWRELGRLRREDLMDDAGAIVAYEKALELRPSDEDVQRALEQIKAVGERWQEISQHFIDQADQASDASLKTSLLVRAASILWQYKKKGKNKEVDRLFKGALETDPASSRAARLYEITLRDREKWKELGDVLLSAAGNASGRDDQLGLFLAAARVLANKLDDKERATSCYERVLELVPAHDEALGFLVSHFTELEMWDHLVALYEDALRARQLKADAEQGMLLQIAMVHWRMLKRAERAEPYFARLRRADPAQPVMLDFYREFYGASSDSAKLLAILADAQRRVSSDPERARLSLEIARIAQNEPQGFERAIDAWKIVLRHEPGHVEALTSLKQLYRRSGKWNALVELLRAELDGLAEDKRDQKLALLRELLAVYRDELKLEAMVLSTYNAILQADPTSQEAAGELARTYEAMGRWNDLIPVLTREAETTSDPKRKVELYARVAKLWIDHFSNYNQATAPLEQVLALDPDNREALSQLKDIYTKKRAWKPLYSVLTKEEELTSDPEQKRALVSELATLAGERLHDYPAAIALYERVLAFEPGAAAASRVLDSLEKIAERAKDWHAMARSLEQRLLYVDDVAAKIKLLAKLGSLHAERTEDPAKAVDAWRRVLTLDPKNGRAMRTLREAYLAAGDFDSVESLYAEAGDFEGFVDVLGTAADKTSDLALKLRLSFRAAEIYEQQIREPARAFRSYERVLSVEPSNARAVAALLPIYEKDDKWQRVAQLLEVSLASLAPDANDERLALLKRLADVSHARLREGEGAFKYASAAYALAPTDAEVRTRLEAAAELAHAQDRLIGLYTKRADQCASEKGGSEESVMLRRRVAAIAADKLKRPDEAALQLEKILADRPDDAEASQILERIYRTNQKHDALRSLLSRRLERAEDKAQRIPLLTELARIEEVELKDPKAAIERYRAIHALEPTHDGTLATLDRLLLGEGAHREHTEVLEKRIALAPTAVQRIELSLRAGNSLAQKLDEPQRAIDLYEAVLKADPNEARAVAALEDVASKVPAEALRIGRLLEPVYERTSSLDKLAKVLELRLKTAADEVERRALKLRLAEIAGTQGDPQGAYRTLESAFLDNPANPELWQRIESMAEQAGMQEDLAVAFATVIEAAELSPDEQSELSARAARIYDEMLGQPEKAEPFHVRVLARDPLADTAYDALRELYTNKERWDDLKALYRNRIANTLDVQQKLDLLLQVCFLFEEILDDVELAIRAYQEVLALDPGHPTSLRALERLYTRAERFRDLVGLLEGDRERAEGKEAIELTFRIGELYHIKLKEPALAVDQYAAVLEEQPTHLRAQEALEQLIGEPSQRQRIAGLLEPLYTNQGAHAELSRVLDVQLEALTDPGARVGSLMRLAELKEFRLGLRDQAFQAYIQAVEADPSDAGPRKELARLAGLTQQFDTRAKVLEGALAATDSSEVRTELLAELALLYDVEIVDADRAIDAYTKLIASDADNAEVVLPAARALERLYTTRDDHAALARALRLQIQFEPNLDTKRNLLGQLAELLEQRLNDLPAAVEAWVERLDLDGADLPAMLALERLHEQRGEYLKLVGVLQKHEAVARDESEARALARRVGHLYELKLSDNESAIAAYNDVLSRFGNDRETVSALQRVYAATARHQDLLDALELELDLTQDSGERAEIRFRSAEIMRTQTGALEAALESYQSVLEERPQHAAALSALQEMMASGEHMRIDAARVLVPHYESVADYDRLIRSLEVVAEVDDPGERLAALRRAAQVAEVGLRESGRAFGLMARAVKAALCEHDLGAMLDELDRLATLSARFEPYLQLLREVAPDISDEEVSLTVLMRIAKISRDKLGDRGLAREYFEKALALRPEHAEALSALEALHIESGDHRALLDVLRRMTELVSEPIGRTKLLMRQAELCADKLEDVSAAIEAYERVLEEGPNLDVFIGLERLYERSARWVDLGAMYERQMEAEVGDPVAVRFKLGALHKAHLNDPERALDLFREVLERSPLHEPTQAALEVMLADEVLKPRAAELLEPLYLRKSAWPELSRALEAQLEAEESVETKKVLLSRLAQLHEVQLEDLDAALETFARLFRVDPTDTHTWEAMSRLARVQNRQLRVAEVYEQYLDEHGVQDDIGVKLAVTAAQLREQHGADSVAAAALYQRALTFDPGARSIADALEAALLRQRAADELRVFYRAQADSAENDARRLACLHKLGALLERELNEGDAAVRVFQEILEVDRSDAGAISAVDRLLASANRWSDQAEHVQAQIDASIGEPNELPLKLRLAALHEERLDDVTSAIDVYEDVLRIEPKNAGARAALERLSAKPELIRRVAEILSPIYEAGGEWTKQIALNEQLFAIETDLAERSRLLLEIAQLFEVAGKSPREALKAFRRALVVDPRDDQARIEIERLATLLGDWDALVAAYEAAVVAANENDVRAGLLSAIARTHDERRGDPRAAITAYERLVQIDTEDQAAIEQLESLLTMVGDWRGLVSLLGRKVERSSDPVERAELWRRAGSVLDDLLSDVEGAIAAYRSALEELDDDELSLQALDGLYQRTQDSASLADVLRRLAEVGATPDDRVDANLRLGDVLATRLGRRSEAIESLRRVLDDDPANLQAIEALGALYEAESMWADLLDNLKRRHELAETDEARVELLCRVGKVLEEKLGEPEEAIESHSGVLALAPTHEESIRALLRIGEHAEWRTRVETVLEPVLRAHERWAELATVMTRSVGAIVDPVDRQVHLVRIAEVYERGLKDLRAAFESLCEALAQDADDDALQAEVERLAQATSGWEAAAEAFEKRALATSDAYVARDLFRRAARIAEVELRDPERAISDLVRAVERGGDEESLLAELDRLYSAAHRDRDLADVLERRVAQASDNQDAIALLVRLGELREQKFGDRRGALSAFREVIEREPLDPRAVVAFERLLADPELSAEVIELLDGIYRQAGDMARVAELTETRVKLATDVPERVALLTELAGVWERDLADFGKAANALRRAFELDHTDFSLLDEIERVAVAGGTYDVLRGLVENAAASSDVARTDRRDLWMRAAGLYREHLRDMEAAERCLLSALEVDPEHEPAHEALTQRLRDAHRYADLVAALSRWADRESDRFVAIGRLSEAAQIAEGLASDQERAVRCYERILELDGGYADALDQLIRIHEAASRHGKVVKLLDRRIDAETDPDVRRPLRARAAELRITLDDREGAIRLYLGNLDDEPNDLAALNALRSLYEQLERWDELVDILGRLLEASETPEQRVGVRVQLALVSEQKLGQTTQAIDQLSELLAEMPDHPEASLALERLLEKEGRNDDLVAQLERRADRAQDVGDSVGELSALVRLGEVLQEKLGDGERAAACYERVLERDPDHVGALRALAKLYVAQDDAERGVAILERLLSQLTGDELVSVGHQLAELSEQKLASRDRAEAALLRALEAGTREEETRSRLAALYERHSDHAALAELLLDSVDRLDDKSAQVALLRRVADIYRLQLADAGSAANALERASQIVPDDRSVLIPLCELYIAAGRQESAVPVLQQIIASYGGKRVKELAVFHRMLSQAFRGLGNAEKALTELDAAYRVDLTNVAVLADLGLLCYEHGDLDRAQKTFRGLLLQKLDKDAPISKADVYFYLGDISRQQGDKPKAVSMLERAVAEQASHDRARSLLATLRT